MGVIWLFKEREALAQSAFYYLDRVIDYMNTEGWGLTGDARKDSKFRDLEFSKLDGSLGKIIAEAKGGKTKRSPYSKEIKKSIVKYILQWLECSEDNRYPFWLFLSHASKKAEWEMLFADTAQPDKRKEYIQQLIDLTEETDKLLLESTDITEIDHFFVQAKLVVGTTEDLRMAADMNRKRHPESLYNQLTSINKQRNEDEMPIKGDFSVALGLAPLSFETQTVYVAELPRISKKEIYDTISGDWNLGCYIPYGNNLIWTFENVEAPSSIFQILDFGWSMEDLNDVDQHTVTLLSNITIRNILKRVNVMHVPSRDIWGIPVRKRNVYFQPPSKKEPSTKIDREEEGKRKIQLTRKVEGYNTFYFHIACEIKAQNLFGQWFVIFKPQHWFTRDGYAPLPPESRRRLGLKYRNPLYNIPSTWLNRTETWHSQLRRALELRIIDYFDELRLPALLPFKIGKLCEVRTGFGPSKLEDEET